MRTEVGKAHARPCTLEAKLAQVMRDRMARYWWRVRAQRQFAIRAMIRNHTYPDGINETNGPAVCAGLMRDLNEL